jgi:hypothetical protein
VGSAIPRISQGSRAGGADPQGLSLWHEGEEAEDFRQFFVDHMKKVIALRATEKLAQGRYVSKNNANVARIGLLRRLFPDGHILVPFRHPADQAMSLLRQHQRFLALHQSEPFSKRYMNDIGHLEFGELHRPICFEGAIVPLRRCQLETLDYWLAYWVSAFGHIMQHKDQVLLLSYERLCEQGITALSAIQACVQIRPTEVLDEVATVFKAPTRYNLDNEVQDHDLLNRALALHRCLMEASVV